MGLLKTAVSCVLSLVVCLSLFASLAKAVDHSDGDYWLYEGRMGLDEMVLQGSLRYELEEKVSMALGSESYDVDVLKVAGVMEGVVEDELGLTTSLEMVISGHVFEIEDSVAIVKEEVYTWGNLTVGTDSLIFVSRVETQEVTTYSPPFLSGFVLGEIGAGDEWNEITEMTRTSCLWTNGTMDSAWTDEDVETYSCSVAEEDVTTAAGTFSCLRLTISGGAGSAQEVRWYSSDVGGWVRLSRYMSDSEPCMIIELSEYSYTVAIPSSVLIIVGAGAMVTVAVIIVVLLLARGKGGSPVAVPPQTPPPT